MVSVGITGGIGSGKTTVCKVWEYLGAYVLNADDLAKSIMAENDEVISAIKETFGPEAYLDDGSLNRTFLAREAFNKGRVEELNAIVHPRIPEKSKQIMEMAQEKGYPVFVYEAALLLQNVRPGFLDYIVLVLADQEKRVDRVQERNGVSADEVLERMHKQQDFERLTHLADVVIRNNGTLEELKKRSKQIYTIFLEKE